MKEMEEKEDDAEVKAEGKREKEGERQVKEEDERRDGTEGMRSPCSSQLFPRGGCSHFIHMMF